MILQRYYINIIVRIILLSITSLLFTWSWTNIRHLFTFFILGSIFTVQVILLIIYLNKVNRDLTRFFLSLKSNDLTTGFAFQPGRSIHRGFQKIMNEIIISIEKVRIEKEYHYQYLQYIIEHVDVGLVSFETNGKIDLVNPALKKLLKIPPIKNIRRLNIIHPEFEMNLNTLKPGQHKLMIIEVRGHMLHLVLRATEFRLRNKNMKLVSIQNIRTELDEKELVSWQKLIRVLTHEIMNSISPIASLATTLSRLFTRKDGPVPVSELKDNHIEDASKGLEIIGSRSKGLLGFVKQYRKINLLPKPDLEPFRISDLFQHIQTFFESEVNQKDITFESVIIPDDLLLSADRKMIEQVLINLINNSIEALQIIKKGSIKLNAFLNDEEQVVIQVTDNGSGIQADLIESIFVPFFTTKKNGSGIGLSLARQIMHLHRGNISVQTIFGKETTFNLLFKENDIEEG